MLRSPRALGTLLFLGVLVVILVWTSGSQANVDVPVDNTGAPKEGSDCASCHWHAPVNETDPGSMTVTIEKNGTAGSVEYDDGDWVYVNVTIDSSYEDNEWVFFGFSMVALDRNDTSVGTWDILTLNPPANDLKTESKTVDTLAREFVASGTRNYPGTNNRTWSFGWSAQGHYGDVTFFYSGLAADFEALDDNPNQTFSGQNVLEGVNRVPRLNNPNVNPTLDNEAADFTYSVEFKDADGDIPGNISVIIDGGVLNLSLEAVDQTETYDGRGYNLTIPGSTLGIGTHNYQFYADDGSGAKAIGQGTIVSRGPDVNDLPILSNAGLSPADGSSDTLFNFTVNFTDPNTEQVPEFVNLSLNGVFVQMAQVNGSDDNYTDGAEFYVELRMSGGGNPLQDGWNNYLFNGTDGVSFVELAGGQFLINNAPSLTNPFVEPNPGGQNDTFYFNVTYTDPNGDPPLDLWLVVDDDEAFNLTAFHVGGGNYSANVTGLEWGRFDVTYEAADIYGVNATPTDPIQVLVNDEPMVENLAVMATAGALWESYTFNATVTDQNLGQTILVYLVIPGQVDRLMATAGNVTLGANYTLTLTGEDLGSGQHSFTVRAEDDFTSTTSTAVNDPYVNQRPTLTNGLVNPNNGWLGTNFNFNVTYTDTDNNTNPTVELVIDDGTTERVYVMNRLGNDSYDEGRQFFYIIDGTLAGADLDGGDFTFWFRANDTLDNVTTTTQDLYISPQPVEVRAPADLMLLPGTHQYDFTIFNYQAVEDTFDLVNTSAWNVVTLVGGIAADNITVSASSNRMITLEITVPVLRNGTQDLLSLNATSQADANLTSEDNLTTTLDQFGAASVTAEDPTEQTDLQGTVVSYDFNVTNDGNEDDNFTFTVVSDLGWTVTTPNDVAIAYQGWAIVTVDVTIPDIQNGTTSIITLTATSLTDGAFSEDTVNATVALYARADLDEPADLNGPPGVLTYTFTVTNNGNDADTYTINAVSQNGWTLSYPGNVPVPYQGVPQTFDVDVTIPEILAGSAVDKLTVTITSGNDNGQTDEYIVTTGVTQQAKVQVSAPAPVTGAPSSIITYTFSVTNQGNAADTFLMDYDVPNGWGVSGTPTIGPLDPGVTGTVDVGVTVPASATGNFGVTGDLTVTATSQFDGGVFTSDTVTSTIGQAYDLDLSFTPSITSVDLTVGQDETVTLVIENQGNGPDTFSLKTSGDGASWFKSFSSTSVNLASGATGQVTVTLNVPTGTSNSASKTLTIYATSHDAEQTIPLTLNVDDGSYGHTAFFDPVAITINVGESATVNFTVTNTGQSNANFHLGFPDLPVGWKASFDSSSTLITNGNQKLFEVEISVPDTANSTDPETFTLTAFNDITAGLVSNFISVTVNYPQETATWSIQPQTATVTSNEQTTFTLVEGGRAFGDDLTIDWDFGDGSAKAMDGGITQSHKYTRSGDYTITLTITDQHGLVTTFSFDITVDNTVPAPVQPPKLNEVLMVADQTVSFTEGKELVLTLEKNDLLSLDSDGEVTALVVDWDNGRTLIPSDDWETTITVPHTYAKPGKYTFQVYAVDNAGDTGATFAQTIVIEEAKEGTSTFGSLISLLMILITLFVGVLLLAATMHYQSKQQQQSSRGGGISFRPTSPDPAFTPSAPSELSDEDRKRIDELERRLERLAEKEELMEVASYDATRVTTMLENHLKQFDEILVRAQELAAKERLEQLQKEMDELEQKQHEEELAESDPDIERLSVAFTETLHRLVKTREKLSKIEGQLTNILKQERDEYEMELERVSQTYDETVRKISALEELAQMRAQSQDEQTLMDLLTAEGTDTSADTGYDDSGDYYDDGGYSDDGYDDYSDDDYAEDDYEDLEDDEEFEDYEEEEVAECGECNAEIPGDATECPNCGASFE